MAVLLISTTVFLLSAFCKINSLFFIKDLNAKYSSLNKLVPKKLLVSLNDEQTQSLNLDFIKSLSKLVTPKEFISLH